ncbi:gamma-glutamylcyclotransferase family protein [Streptomyces mirabilis]
MIETEPSCRTTSPPSTRQARTARYRTDSLPALPRCSSTALSSSTPCSPGSSGACLKGRPPSPTDGGPALEGRAYPGLVLAPGSAAAGFLLTDLSQREWGILDAFEDDRYDLRKLCLTSGAPGWGYVWPGGEVRDEDWEAEHFVTRHLQECSTSRSRTGAGKLRTR